MFRSPNEKGKKHSCVQVGTQFIASQKKGDTIMANLNHPANLKYTRSDEWVRVEGDQATIGITDYAQDQLGDIVYIELPWNASQSVSHEAKFGDIESVKATSELLSPISGEVVKVNEALKDKPELINDSPYDEGWMLVIKITKPEELDSLMSAEEYQKYLQGR
jgi:glycine cleavage system H protein